MKKFILSIIVIVSFGFYVISQNTSGSSGNLSLPPIVSSNTNVSSKKQPISSLIATTSPDDSIVSSSDTASTTPTSSPTKKQIAVAPKKTGLYNNGTYVGTRADAYFGNVQVKAIISNGKLTDVQFLDYPRDRSTSVRINSRALPILKQEAITAQSANINAVSGASATSPAFISSLANALSQAKA